MLSANRWKEASESDLCISLIKTTKINGPRTLSCGTPHAMEACLQFLQTGFYHIFPNKHPGHL